MNFGQSCHHKYKKKMFLYKRQYTFFLERYLKDACLTYCTLVSNLGWTDILPTDDNNILLLDNPEIIVMGLITYT